MSDGDKYNGEKLREREKEWWKLHFKWSEKASLSR